MTDYQMYLDAVKKPFKKVTKLEFLQPDGTVAFALGNKFKTGYMGKKDTRTFIQSGTLSVSLQNGQRRKATVQLANRDNVFDYNVNNLWYGQQVRLLMGLVLPTGKEFCLPQGVFYISNPQEVYNASEKTMTLNLVDKWAYLDGTLFGTLSSAYEVSKSVGPLQNDIFQAMASLLKLSRIDGSNNGARPIDSVTPVFTNYYDNKKYTVNDGETETEVSMRIVPYDINVGGDNSTIADILLELNSIIVGWIGYDQTGTLRVDPSQDDISDVGKPVLWDFSPENSYLCGLTETIANGDVKNDIIIVGENADQQEVYGRASNYDAHSDTNINIIGRRTYRESKASYWYAGQCSALAEFYLKRKTVAQKSVTIECSQLFHLMENNLVTVRRTDKKGAPIERHIIQDFSVPIGETGTMTINAISVLDFPVLTFYSSLPRLPLAYQEVSWISSTGTAYIDTGLDIRNQYQIELQGYFETFAGSEDWMFGDWNTGGNQQLIGFYGDYYQTSCGNESNKLRAEHGIGNSPVVFKIFNNDMEIGNDTLYNTNFSLLSSMTSRNLCLFKSNHYNQGSNQKVIYYCKMFNLSGNLIRNFVPCYRKEDAALGMYDLVTGEFFGNAGTGVFIKGPDIM